MTETNITDELDNIPDNLRFDYDTRPAAEERAEGRTPFALSGKIYHASKPLDYTMLMLGSAMSGYADGPDRAYAIMTFCHDAFDGPTRDVVRQLPGDKLLHVIESLCEQWGEDTSKWQTDATPANREGRRAQMRTGNRRR